MSIDRLGCNYDEIPEQWRILIRKKSVNSVVMDFHLLVPRTRLEGQDLTGGFAADLVLQILAYVAQKEREAIHRRQAERIAAAKAAGKRWGKPGIPPPAVVDEYGYCGGRKQFLSFRSRSNWAYPKVPFINLLEYEKKVERHLLKTTKFEKISKKFFPLILSDDYKKEPCMVKYSQQ